MLKFLRVFPCEITPKSNPLINHFRYSSINNNTILDPINYSNSSQIQEQSNPSSNPVILFKKLLATPNPSFSIIDQWVKEVKPVDVSDILSIIKRLRSYKQYHQALQLGEWMFERKYLLSSPGNVALKLDLINKVHGVEKAEDYFLSISDELKTFKVYGALLNCFAENRLVDKAENVMQQMRELNYSSELSYGVLLNLYARLKENSKLDVLVLEMEGIGIIGKPAYRILLNFYADNANLERMENILSKMEDNLLITVEWNEYVIVAKGYLKSGLAEKSTEMLKKAEKHITARERKIAYRILISMYATLGNGNEVQRIWNLPEAIGIKNNVGYFYMVSSLVRLDKMDLAEKLLDEWESVNEVFDFRILNVMINAYTKKDLLAKAEALVNKALDSGKKPPTSTWDLLATGYYKCNQMEKAVEAMIKAIHGDRSSWKLNRDTLTACHKYLKDKGDVQIAEEFLRNLEKFGLKSQRSVERSSTDTPLYVTVNNQQTDLHAS